MMNEPPQMSQFALPSSIHSFENDKKSQSSENFIQFLVKEGHLKTALAIHCFTTTNLATLLLSMNFENHQLLLSTLKFKCPILFDLMIKPELILKGLSNTCIIPWKNGNYLLNVRIVNYILNEQAQFLLPQGVNYFETHNLCVETANDLKQVIFEKRFENIWKQDCPYRGIEDIRFIEKDGKIFYIATICHENRLMMSFHEYNKDNKSLEIQPIYSPYYRNVEKNWSMFLNHENDLLFVYQWFPLEIGKIEKNKLTIIHQKDYGLWFMSRIKGSSTGCLEKSSGLLWFLVHFHSDDKPRQYYHMFVLMNPSTYDIVRISSPFLFEDVKVQFGMGLVIEDERIIMTYTVFDRDTRVASYDKSKLINELFREDRMIIHG